MQSVTRPMVPNLSGEGWDVNHLRIKDTLRGGVDRELWVIGRDRKECNFGGRLSREDLAVNTLKLLV